MSSPTIHEPPKFHAGAPSNLDRCDLCGEPRSAHGPDWECPTGNRGLGRGPVVALATGGLLMVAGFIMYISTPSPPRGLSGAAQIVNSAGGIILICGLTTAVAAAIVISRRNQGRS